MYQPIENEIFHIHTWRCKHASMDEDYRYIESAIKLGAKRIVFTDHCPFPGNPFGLRMDIGQLPAYIKTMKELKKHYAANIEVLVGLEIEYLPSFESFYKELSDSKELDLLMLGQHFYEKENGDWSFHDSDKSEEYIGLCKALIQGAETGMFDVIAHPDRSFRNCKEWNSGLMHASYDVAMAAAKNGVILEKNLASINRKRQYWPPFWVRTGDAAIMEGYDAHSVAEMEEMWKRKHTFITQDEINKLLGGC